MRQTTSTIFLHALSSFNIILICLANNGSTFCDHVQCKNNSPCRTTTLSHKKGGSDVSAECVCHGKWTGPRCESLIHLTPRNVHGNNVELEINAGPKSSDSSKHVGYSRFTLLYWTNSSDDSCVMIQELTSLVKRIDGLLPNTQYTFCVESGTVDSCFPAFHNETVMTPNCFSLTTGTRTLARPSRQFNTSAIVGTVVIVILVIIILVAAVLIRRRHFIFFDNLFGLCRCSCCYSFSKRRSRSPRHTAATDLIVSPDSPLVMAPKHDFSTSRPGKPKLRLSKSVWGYTSYKAKNNKNMVLTTVLEYPHNEVEDRVLMENVCLFDLS
ncbi:uncharacterized protein LOC121383028 [Gigantopelta aegis]|uniref:uncharacterized protein LOC121383028 n=1 Tax=Gigantopelta aegis TaxID=1735272 RepID=UPI001B889D21|nr:uncharacterized protein LOC121383028 [Gigantopelta aegis]